MDSSLESSYQPKPNNVLDLCEQVLQFITSKCPNRALSGLTSWGSDPSGYLDENSMGPRELLGPVWFTDATFQHQWFNRLTGLRQTPNFSGWVVIFFSGWVVIFFPSHPVYLLQPSYPAVLSPIIGIINMDKLIPILLAYIIGFSNVNTNDTTCDFQNIIHFRATLFA